MLIKNLTKGNVVCDANEAKSFIGRVRGLMFKRNLEEGRGLLIQLRYRYPSVHSCFMSFPIDLIFLDPGKKVVDVHSLNPWRFYSARGSCAWVLEVGSGTIVEKAVEIGDVFGFSEE